MKEKEKIKIKINDVCVIIPKTNIAIDDTFTAIELALELYGWHRNTIHEYIIARAEDLKEL